MGEMWKPKHEEKYGVSGFEQPSMNTEEKERLLKSIAEIARTVVQELVKKESPQQPLPRDVKELRMVYMATLDEYLEEEGIFFDVHKILNAGDDEAWKKIESPFNDLQAYVSSTKPTAQ